MRARLGLELVERHDLVDRTAAVQVFHRDTATGEEVRADHMQRRHARQKRGAAHRPAVDLGQREKGAFRGDQAVAGPAIFTPPPMTKPCNAPTTGTAQSLIALKVR